MPPVHDYGANVLMTSVVYPTAQAYTTQEYRTAQYSNRHCTIAVSRTKLLFDMYFGIHLDRLMRIYVAEHAPIVFVNAPA